MIDEQDLALIDERIQQMMLAMGVGGFVPGLDEMIAEFFIIQLNGTISSDATLTLSEAMSGEIGFLWRGLSVDSTGEYSFKVHIDASGDFTPDGDEIHSNTFSGLGNNDDAKDPSSLECSHFISGGSTIRLDFTDLSSASNPVFATLTGIRVRPKTMFHDGVKRAQTYIGLVG